MIANLCSIDLTSCPTSRSASVDCLQPAATGAGDPSSKQLKEVGPFPPAPGKTAGNSGKESNLHKFVNRIVGNYDTTGRDWTMTDTDDIWSTCLAHLRRQVPEPTFNAWIAPLSLVEACSPRFVVAAPNTMVLQLVTTRFYTLIQEVLSDVTDIASPDVELVVQAPVVSDEPADDVDVDVLATAGATRRGQTSATNGTVLQTGSSTAPAGGGVPPRNDRRPLTALNPRYTFEAFVIGASNRFAHAAAQRVAEEPAKSYNPLFIYGASGLGKTHMLHAIGHYVYQNFTNLNVCYVSTETFLNEFIDSIRTRGQTAFKRRYRAYDILLVDDIQLLEGKKETQEEFFYTFNSFYETDKQIVISSDRHPRAIATLEDRLRSRFESGLITDVQPPELETRLAILRKKAEGERAMVPEDVLELIATHVKDNIRELQGSLDPALCLRQHSSGTRYRPTGVGGPV